MNNDEQFENRLRRQTLRTLPPEWRGEILKVAAARQPASAVPHGDEDSVALIVGWRLLIGRMPLAWAALAALWVGMIGVNLTMPGPIVSVVMQTPASDRLSVLAALDSPLTDFDAASDSTLPVPKASPATPPSDVPLRPRSERRGEVNFGETHPNSSFHLIT